MIDKIRVECYDNKNRELKILNLLWESENTIPISKIIIKLEEPDIHWVHTTIGTFLKRMQEKKVVTSEKGEKIFYFYPIAKKDEVDTNETKKYLDFNYNGSMFQFLSAFTKDNDLSKEEIEALGNWLDKLNDKMAHAR